jgi:hypothetical protein
MRRILSLAVLATLIATLLGNASSQTALAKPAGPLWQPPLSTGDCRFGTTYSLSASTPESINRYDLPLLGVGNYLNFQYQKPTSVPNYIQFVEVLPTSDVYFPGGLANLPVALAAHPGGTWIIGNEPEDRGQEHVTPEVYADRFYQYATMIRNIDSTAKIAFGPIVSPTPLRLMYLDFAWTRLIQLAGDQTKASALIDIWAIHNFILNEQGDVNGVSFWGMGIPWGFYTRVPPINWSSMQVIMPPEQTPEMAYNFTIFRDRMIAFRQFMKDRGQQNKPLWLTEYGQLFPPLTTPQENLITVPDLTTADFLKQTWDWMLDLAYADPALGMTDDQNRLVQKWFWFSINHSRYQFGGTMVDPDTLQRTPIGDAWVNYVPPAGSIDIRQPDVYPLEVSPRIIGFNPSNPQQASYRLHVRIRNAIIADHFVDVQVNVKDGASTIASGTGRTARCGGDAVISLNLSNITVFPQKSVCVEVQPTTLTDINMANNSLCVDLPTTLYHGHLPLIGRN